MTGAASLEKLLFHAIRSSPRLPLTSLRGSSRIRRVHSTTGNCAPSTSLSIRWTACRQGRLSQARSCFPSSQPPALVHSRRTFSSSPVPLHGHLTPPKPGQERKVTFIDKEGQSHTLEVSDGDNLLDIAQANDLEMEGACGGSCACSTCHVIVESDHYDLMTEPDDDENDMLDLAFGLTETSRLGCQVKMAKELDGLVVRLPSMTRNMQASDFESK
ncbi:ferredoxin [Lindgomyces ingoldianus]|uniref:Ferredoxin n=1 Tax=Lindgomyces ingoldianus TaxID=673940 RepID=A0ACB6QRI4_9PLEO|nr:ferredoxin [Lindgomyces ingoldianus]KAF2469614.1 ferredoxin [Lindgomyces ingoldianus]